MLLNPFFRPFIKCLFYKVVVRDYGITFFASYKIKISYIAKIVTVEIFVLVACRYKFGVIIIEP